jgi:hypothetical protein
MSDRIMLKQGTHYHATEDGFIEIWPAGLAFAAEVNRAGRDAWVERQLRAWQPKPSGSQRPDCVAGHIGLELRNVVANYPFERSHRFVGISRILTTETIRG